MSVPENVRSTRVGLTFARMGSFWTETFKNKAQIRRLINLVHQTTILQNFESTCNNLAGVPDEKDRIANQLVVYDKNDVIQGGDQFYDDLRLQYGTDFDFPGVYGGGNAQFWILPLTTFVPFVIQAKTRRLLVGVDFFVYKNEWIFFRDNPAEVFDGEKFVIINGKRHTPWALEYVAQVSPPDSMKHVVNYARNSQAPNALELALASVAGMKILNFTQRLLIARMENSVTVYTFDKEVVRVSYPHDKLLIGKLYHKDFIIGEGVKVYANTRTAAWWRAIDWRGGLSLDPIVDAKGLFLKDEDVTAYAAGTDEGSVAGDKVHARMDLTGNFDLEKPYWDKVAQRETSQGYYLNSVLGLLTDQQAVTVRVEEPGANYAVNDTIVLTGGKYTTPVTIKVTSVSGDGVDEAIVVEPGAYTVIPDVPTAQGTTSGFGVNASFTVTWEYADDPYAALVDQMEEVTRLNRLFNYDPEQLNPRRLPHTKLVNPIDIYFQAVLTPRCIVITLDQSVIPADRQAELFRYLARELPIGVLSIVFCYAPGLPEDTFSLADSTESVDIIDFNEDDLHEPEESFSLTSSSDFVTITQEA